MSEGNLSLRPLRFSDAPFLKSGFNREESLRANGLTSPVSASGTAIRRWIKKTYDLAWCIEVDSRPAGFAGVYRLRPGKSAETSLIVFDRALWCRGYGGRAFRLVAGTLSVRAGVKELAVSVLKDNLAALSFWKKMGFGYSGCKDGICRMKLDLSRGSSCLSPAKQLAVKEDSS
jgi:RimJ/RimL family protein N-acetyltransferase